MQYEPPTEYSNIPHLQFADYSKGEYERLLDAINAHEFPTPVEFQTADPLSPNAWELVISVTAETHGYPSEKELAIQPGQLVIWFGVWIYVLSCTKQGTTQMDTYRHPGIQDVDTGGRL
jgi:hypothetical protein